jgi:16S rRNA (guanine527-N7)-methyltransferase
VFAGALPQAERFAELLATTGVERGLIGPREVDRLWQRHLLNCASLADLVPLHAGVADVGSGAGLPGIVLALQRPDLELTLVEPLLRRATFMTEVVADLELPRVTVVRARAEDLVGELVVDVAVARALAPLDRLARWTVPLVGLPGCVLALKGAQVSAELEAAAPVLDALEVQAEILVLEVGGDPTRVVRLTRLASPPGSAPRSSPGSAPRSPLREEEP